MRTVYLFLLFCTTAIYAQTFTRVTAGDIGTNTGISTSVNFVDYDNDGDLDLFVANSESPRFLYNNDGQGNFTRVTDSAILPNSNHAVGSTWGDYDNDGDADCFVANWYNQHNDLYRNEGAGVFTDLTLPPITNGGGYSESGSWADYDNDGWLDLFVANSAGTNHRNFVYHNNGGGSFTRITTGDLAESGFNSRCGVWCDYDNDGDMDVFTPNESNQNNCLYQNNGNGNFTRITVGPQVNDQGTSMTASWGDIDNDGDFDLFVGNIEGETNFLYTNNGDGSFTAVTEGVVVTNVAWTFGSAFGDYDNDGDLDLIAANGYGPNGQGYRRNYLYENDGTGVFLRVMNEPVAVDSGWGFGCEWGDIDTDGDLDLFIARWRGSGETNLLYMNGGNENHWLTVKCIGTTSNRSGIGARLRLKATLNNQSVWQIREISGQSGYCGQNLEAHFGLADAAFIDTLFIQWPSGNTDTLAQIAANQRIIVTETEGYQFVEHPADPLPDDYTLLEIFPNPFNLRTTLQFELAKTAHVSLKLVDVLGREVSVIADEVYSAGKHAADIDGQLLATGEYFVRFTEGTITKIKKLTLIK